MQNQESMFEKPEPTPVQPINSDPREQAQRHEMPPTEGNEEGYKGYSEGYNGQPYGEPWQAEGEKIQPRQKSRKRRGMKPLVIVLIIIALLVGFAGMSSTNFRGTERVIPAQVYTVSSAPTLVLDNGSGDVHVHVGNVNNVVVSARERGFGMFRDNDEQQMVTTEQQGNTITVSPTRRSGMFGQQVDLDITVPTATNLELHTTSGDINVEGVNGQVTLATESGDIKGSNLSGVLNTSTTSGDVKLEQTLLRGNSSLKTNSGKIELEGDIDTQGDYEFQTNSGDVELKLSRSSIFHLVPSTNSGHIENEFGRSQGNNSGGPQVKITTNSGDISVQSRDD
jgi:hypothetical protein